MSLSFRLLVLVPAIAGCQAALPSGAGGPADPSAEMQPELIVVDEPRVSPGDVLAITFPAETSRGIHFVLERDVGGGWIHEFDLVSDSPGPGWQRGWSRAGDEGFAIPDIGVGGPGPDRVPIPEAAEPGRWRICTGNAGQNICTEIEILDAQSSAGR